MKNEVKYYAPHELLRRIKEARRAARLSQQEMADAMGIHVTTYGKWELGKRQLGLAELSKIAAIVKKDISYFTGPPIFNTEISKISVFLWSQEKTELRQRIYEIITEWDAEAQKDLLLWCAGYEQGLNRAQNR